MDAPVPNQFSASPFLDLPIELRNLIYTFALTCAQPIPHLRCPKTFPDTYQKLQTKYTKPVLCQDSYDEALPNLLPGLGLLAVNKQIYNETQPILLQENTIRFENLIPPGIPEGRSLELMKNATKFQIFFNFLTAGVEKVVEMLVAHRNLHNVSLHFQFTRANRRDFCSLSWKMGFSDTRRATEELMPILDAVQGPEADR